MKRYDVILLNSLVDKYEKSSLYRGENQVKVTISYRFNKKTLPEYFDDFDYTAKEMIHEYCLNLQEKEWVTIVWHKYEEYNIIKQLNLNINHVSDVYLFLNRKEKKSLERQAINLLTEYLERTSYIGEFARDMIAQLNEGKGIQRYLDIEEPQLIKDILYGLDRIIKQEVEVSKRIFSIQLFNNSKHLEGIEPKIERIMRDYGQYVTYNDLLAEENIIKNPGFVYIKGAGTFQFANQVIDLKTLMNKEIGLSSDLIDAMSVIDLDVDRIITIENLTTFHTYSNPNELVIYLGGFHNTIRRNFLLKLYHSNPNLKFYHWGDIDLGGFRIFRDLQLKTGIPFKAYKMDLDTLLKYQSYAFKITSKAYSKHLEALLNDDGYDEFKGVIRYMLEYQIRLEQEIIE